ncbi:MAG: hypothetical protein M3N50_05980 [Pseudomonadota bacterium]|nr:hypothetical protein [Pseudomonadota bacterium]
MKRLAVLCAALASWSWTAPSLGAAAAADAPALVRVESRSADLLAVALVHDDRMSIHLSRLLDNAPVHDAVVKVVLRGVVHPTTAESDGSYSLQSHELSLPGATAVEFQIAQAAGLESLKGVLQIADVPSPSEDKNGARQFWWWVLNFAVCIGFLLLISRRRKRTQD